MTRKAAMAYIKKWKNRGYRKDIPDQSPQVLERRGLAPSYRAICLAILSNDIELKTLGVKKDWRKSIIETRKMKDALLVKDVKSEPLF